jgi:hypothetical protein
VEKTRRIGLKKICCIFVFQKKRNKNKIKDAFSIRELYLNSICFVIRNISPSVCIQNPLHDRQNDDTYVIKASWVSASKNNVRLKNQGCQMVCFQTKNPNLGKFWRVFVMENLGIFYDH